MRNEKQAISSPTTEWIQQRIPRDRNESPADVFDEIE
jgi:hypothetical protein